MQDTQEHPPGLFPARSLANLHPYNHATAKLAGIKSGQARRERANRKRTIELSAQVQAAAEPDARLVLLEEQIRHTRRVLNDSRSDFCPVCERGGLSGKDRAGLLRALCGLLDQQRIARGEPLPGSRRPRADDRTPAAPAAYRIHDQPAPAPVVPAVQAVDQGVATCAACGPGTPISSVPSQAPVVPRPQDAPLP